MSLPSSIPAILALGLATASLAETLTLPATADSYIRASQGNQGANNLAIVGDTANPDDYLRAAFAFDLAAPELADAVITGATLTLTIDGRDTSSGGSGNTQSMIDLHPLDASFTNDGVTWTSRNGTDDWSTPGADFGGVQASVAANAGTVNGGDKLTFASQPLTDAVVAASGGPIHLLAKLEVEDADRSVFRIASENHATASKRPVLVIDYAPNVNDPTLRLDTATGDPDLTFGILTGDFPITATRTLRFINEGPTNPITIESAAVSGSGVFTLEDIAVASSGGQSLPVTLQIGGTLALEVSASFSDYNPSVRATLTLDTSDDLRDRAFSASAAFPEPGSAVAQPAIPGKPASAAYQVRVGGVPVPVNDESYFDFHTAFFSMDDPVMVEVEFLNGVSYSSIHPLRHGIQPEVSGNIISFPLVEPHKLVIKAAGALPLVLCATPIEEKNPQIFTNFSHATSP